MIGCFYGNLYTDELQYFKFDSDVVGEKTFKAKVDDLNAKEYDDIFNLSILY